MRGQTELIIGFIGLVVFILIALSLVPTISTQTTTTRSIPNGASINNSNLSSATDAMLQLTPLLYVVVIIVAILGYVTMKSG
jgi:hypothetical protein